MIDSRGGVRFVISQASWLALGRIAAGLISAIWFVIAARSLPLGEFGSLALLLGLGLMTAFLTDLGLTGVASDAVAREPSLARPATALVVRRRMPLAVGASCITAIAYMVANGRGSLAVPALFAVSTLATAAYSTITASFRALGHAGYEGLNEVASRVLVLALAGIALAAGAGLLAVVAVYVVADLASLVALAVVFQWQAPHDTGAPRPELTVWAARSLAAAGIVGTAYFRIDLWLVALLKGDRVVGRYAVAYRCFEALLLPAQAITSLSIPHSAGLEGAALARRLSRLALVSVSITAPFALVSFLGADDIVRLLFGTAFAPAASALRILSIGAVVTAVTSVLVPPMALRSGRVALALVASLALNVAANFLVIPTYGATGAAVVTVVGELFLGAWLVMQVVALTHRGSEQPERLLLAPSTGTPR